MTRAFVLTGGGNLGAVQVGMLAALCQRGIAPDLLIGTSAGALNAAFLAGRAWNTESIDALGRRWLSTRRRDVFPIDPVRQLLALSGRRPSLCSADGLRRLVDGSLPYRRMEDAVVPFQVTATDVLTGEAVSLDHGDASTAVLASAAIPGVFPAVDVEGRSLVDGAVAPSGGVARAVSLGAEDVWVLPAGYACALARPPTGALAAALHAVSLLVHRQSLAEVAGYASVVEMHVLPPLCPLAVSPMDFGRTAQLIERAYQVTRASLADAGDRLPDGDRVLSLHDHRMGDCVRPRVICAPRVLER